MNAYKVWADDVGYLIILARTRGQARARYTCAVDGEFTMPMHIALIERNVEFVSELAYTNSRWVDLILAGVINPDWYERTML